MSALPCPICGIELSFLEEYHRHYCYSCGRYAPEGYGDRGPKNCPMCGGILSYVVAYERYYCYRCNAYPPDETTEPKKEPEPVTPQPIETTSVPISTPVTPTPEPAAAPAATSAKPPAETPPTSPTTTSVVILAPPKRQKPPVDVVEARSPSKPRREEPVEEEIRGDAPSVLAKPPLTREDILHAKKPALLDLCKAYDLDPSGTKELLRERLLSYLDELEAEPGPEGEEPTSEAEADEPEEAERAFEEPESPPTTAPATQPAVSEELPWLKPTPITPPVSAPVAATTTPQVVQETTPVAEAAQPGPVLVVPETPAVREAPTIEHPCPNCGRELTYIAQYNRWYCYSCRAYAPAAKPKNACPNCGATLRWIGQYERWWCDSCRRYAPADLPKPEGAFATAAAAVAVEKPLVAAALRPSAVVVHRHRSPGSGIGLMGIGLVLFVLYEVLVDLPTVLAFSTGLALAPDVEWGMRFFAFVFVAGGAMLGMFAMRDRR